MPVDCLPIIRNVDDRRQPGGAVRRWRARGDAGDVRVRARQLDPRQPRRRQLLRHHHADERGLQPRHRQLLPTPYRPARRPTASSRILGDRPQRPGPPRRPDPERRALAGQRRPWTVEPAAACAAAATTADQRGLARPQRKCRRDGRRAATSAPSRCRTWSSARRSMPCRPVAAPSAACRNATSECSLRQAVLDGNAFGGAAITLFHRRRSASPRTGRDEDAALTGDLDVTAPLIVSSVSARDGHDHPGRHVNATDGIDRIFDVHPVSVSSPSAT